MRFTGLCLLIFLQIHLYSQSAQTSNGVSYGMNLVAGKILIHTPSVYFLKGSYPQALEFSYRKQTTGTKEWQQRFGFPEIGLNIAVTNYDFSYFGKAIGFYPSIQFKVLPLGSGMWFFKVGGGIGAISKHWERTASTDSFDNFIGSTINNFTMFQSGIKLYPFKHWSFQTGLGFYHVSNAATRQPNYGINTIGIFAGLCYHPQGILNTFEKKELPKHKNPLNLNVAASIGFSEGKAFDGPMYPVYSFTGSAVKMYRNKNRVSVGINAVFNTKTLATIRNSFNYNDHYRLHTWQYSAFIQNEFLFGKIGLPLQLGFYLNNPLAKKLMYQKLGMLYHFYHNQTYFVRDSYLSLILYTHTSRAQYAELGIGFMF